MHEKFEPATELAAIYSINYSNVHTLHLNAVEDRGYYVNWLNLLRSIGEDDLVKIYINSVGGNLLSAMQIANAIKECSAPVIAINDGECISAATIIFLAADVHVCNPNTRFMVHNYTGGIYGKAGEIFSQADYDKQWSAELLTSIYKGFLTDQEIIDVRKGIDVHLTADEVTARCANLVELRKQEGDEVEEEPLEVTVEQKHYNSEI